MLAWNVVIIVYFKALFPWHFSQFQMLVPVLHKTFYFSQQVCRRFMQWCRQLNLWLRGLAETPYRNVGRRVVDTDI
jgi:hypothetical protein